MDKRYLDHLQKELAILSASGLYKNEWEIASPQQPHMKLKDGRTVLNLCANNYLGLANHPALIDSARTSLDTYGFGLASVRFICVKQVIHKELESRLSQFLRMEETILYNSCFDANGGLFEALLGPEDAVISDSLNHASIIDGIRLCKAKRLRYAHSDMADLESKLQEAKDSRFRLIATDGVFSMDGHIARLKEICDLADRYLAMVMVDDCHATGFMGATGRGTPEFCGVEGRVDILTGTLGKALGGASGGYISSRKEIVAMLRQRSRPYLFSNSLVPCLVAAAITALDLVSTQPELRERLHANSRYFRSQLADLPLVPGEHPIIPIMLGDAALAKTFAAKLLEAGIYAVSFSYPVVPEGQARIRTQMSVAHSQEDLDRAIAAFKKIAKELKTELR
ncbi:MAG: glycine C-acetyltransferase [Parachlamydia sp.]|nr:glycine C-acetyltransferase [Parachlamydia sp.]